MKDLLTQASKYLSVDGMETIRYAYDYATQAHMGQNRLSGEPYIEHPVQTASFLAELRLDSTTIAAALLHDVMEDCDVKYEDLKNTFGADVAKLVDGVTKLSKIDSSIEAHPNNLNQETAQNHIHAESLRKMLVSMAEDIRVVLIKLADRLHNMRTLQAHPSERRIAIAQETLDIYAPLAHRLGMWDLKWRLEDLSFRHLQPDRYREMSQLMTRKRAQREEYIEHVASIVRGKLQYADIKAQVTGRPKHLFSTYKKIQRYTILGKDFNDIFDLFAIRVLVKEVEDCYAVLGIVHGLWYPLPRQFDDYIATPKENLYQSLHTAVMGPDGVPVEIQIRTHEMHQLSEYGVAAHWRYKSANTEDIQLDRKLDWLRQLLEWQKETTGAEEFLESVKTDIFPLQLLMYTPRGDLKELPAGSTPIDFAYRVHTELGHACVGAKVNGQLVPLDYNLKTGETIEILTSKPSQGPSLDWLNPGQGYVKSANARQRIRQWFRKQTRNANIQRGEELFHRELRRLDVSPDEGAIAWQDTYKTADDFLAALGSGGLHIDEFMAGLTKGGLGPESDGDNPLSTGDSGPVPAIRVLGVGDLLTHMALCCNPLPGDKIVGFVTRTRGITIHHKDCTKIVTGEERDRLMEVDWGQTEHLYPVRVRIVSWDRVGLLRDITATVSVQGVNIASVVTNEDTEGKASIDLTLYTAGVGPLSILLSKLEGINGVITVNRQSARHQTEETDQHTRTKTK